MIALWLALAAFADDRPVDAKVTEVVVYRDRARVVRAATVDVPAGRTDLVFDGLPIGLVPASLAAEGEGTAGATLTGINVRADRGTEARDARVRALEAERRALTDRIGAQQDVVARAQQDQAFLTSLEPGHRPPSPDTPFVADDAAAQLAALSRTIGADLERLLAEQRAAEIAIRGLQRDVDRVERELAELRSGGERDAVRVAVGIDARAAGRVTVRLQYLVPGPSWSPRYDARYDPASGRVTLDLAGEVRQSTGEDWQDVRLVLSTAQPEAGLAPPTLTPFVLAEGGGRSQGGRAAGARATAYELAADRPEDVPADGTVRRVVLDSFELKSELVHHVVAARVEAAWLTARVRNDTGIPWLEGALSSYLGAAYVGDGRMPATSPGDEADLSFGIDDRVRVEREPLEQIGADARPLGNRERRRQVWKTTVTNRTGRRIALVVHDRVPASRDARWEVTAETTPPVAIPADGVFRWELALEDGKAQELVTGWEVSWPVGDAPQLP